MKAERFINVQPSLFLHCSRHTKSVGTMGGDEIGRSCDDIKRSVDGRGLAYTENTPAMDILSIAGVFSALSLIQENDNVKRNLPIEMFRACIMEA